MTPRAARRPTLEQRMLAMAATTRRHHVLRVVAPGLLTYTLIIVFTGGTLPSPALAVQVAVGVVAFALTLWGVTGKLVSWRVTLAAGVTLGASLVTTGIFIMASGPMAGSLGVPTLAALFLLLVPIIIAGIVGDTWLVIGTALLTSTFSVAVLLLVPLSRELNTFFAAHHQLVIVLALPVIAQVGAAFMLLAGASGSGRMQQILVDWRMAYAREREVDQMREEFIASINHELRNPIMAVQNYLMLADLLGQRGDSDGQQQMVQRGAEVANHLGGLMESIMSIRRLRTANKDVPLAPVPLLPIAERTANMALLLDGNGPHRTQIAVPPDLVALGNEGLLTEMLSNLITNAAKYSPPETTITISARLVPAREVARLRPQFETQRAGTYVMLSVADQGMGIPPDKAPLIFEPFVRLQRDEASSVIGSGMGLAIVQSNVAAMGGDIWVESDGISGHGSIFHIVLAAASATPSSADQPTQKRSTNLSHESSGSN